MGPVPEHICIKRKRSLSIHRAFKGNQINTFLEKMPKENTFKPHSKIALFLFSHLSIFSSYFLCMTFLPTICPLPCQSPLCSSFNWLSSSLRSHLVSPVSSDFPVYSSQQRGAQEMTSRLLFRRKYLKHK